MPKLTITTNDGEVVGTLNLNEDEYPDLDKPLAAADIMEEIRRSAKIAKAKEAKAHAEWEQQKKAKKK